MRARTSPRRGMPMSITRPLELTSQRERDQVTGVALGQVACAPGRFLA